MCVFAIYSEEETNASYHCANMHTYGLRPLRQLLALLKLLSDPDATSPHADKKIAWYSFAHHV